MMSMNLNNITILSIKGSDYCCIISLNSKNNAKKLMQNANLILHTMLPKTSTYVISYDGQTK